MVGEGASVTWGGWVEFIRLLTFTADLPKYQERIRNTALLGAQPRPPLSQLQDNARDVQYEQPESGGAPKYMAEQSKYFARVKRPHEIEKVPPAIEPSGVIHRQHLAGIPLDPYLAAGKATIDLPRLAHFGILNPSRTIGCTPTS